MGGPLVERTTRHCRLTVAGETLVGGARQVLSDLVRLEEITRDAVSGRRAYLRIGSVNPALRILMPRIIRAVRAEIPDVRISLHPANTHGQLRQLMDGQLEAGILRSRDVPAGLVCETLMNEPLYATIPRTHPLATRTSVQIGDLHDEDFVMTPRDRNPYFYDEIIGLFATHQCSPRLIIEAEDMWSLLAMVGAGVGVSLLSLLFVDHDRDDVVFLPVDRSLGLPLVLAYSPNSPAAAVDALIRAAREESANLLDEELRR